MHFAAPHSELPLCQLSQLLSLTQVIDEFIAWQLELQSLLFCAIIQGCEQKSSAGQLVFDFLHIWQSVFREAAQTCKFSLHQFEDFLSSSLAGFCLTPQPAVVFPVKQAPFLFSCKAILQLFLRSLTQQAVILSRHLVGNHHSPGLHKTLDARQAIFRET